jgi:hypothetical protein
MIALSVRKNKGRAGWSMRIWLPGRFLDIGWFHHRSPTFPPRAD